MRKIILCFAGTLMVLSLAACTPTPEKQSETVQAPSVEATTGGAHDKVPDPNVEPMEVIAIYSPNEEGNDLNQAMDAVNELTPQALVDKLIEYGVLDEGTEVLSYEESEGNASLDLSQMPEGSGDMADLLKDAVSSTFIQNFELDEVTILVNGEAA